MAFWGREKWIAANKQAELVSNFDTNFLQDGAYRLSVGDEAIVSSSHEDKEHAYKELSNEGVLSLRPGQFAFLITRERIYLPRTSIGFINVATGTKLKGLVNISGFHVDPGYEGKLIFSVFNAGPTSITIYAGQRMFRLWLSDYDPSGDAEKVESKTTYDRIPREWADTLYGSFPSPFALSARVSQLESDVSTLKAQRNSLLIPGAILALLLFPFVAGLYSNIIASTYTWIKPSNSSNVQPVAVTTQQLPQQAPAPLPPAVISPPAANTPSTAATPGAATRPLQP